MLGVGVYRCVSVWVCACIRMYVCVYVYACTCVCMYIHMHICMCACACVCMSVKYCVCKYLCSHMHVRAPAYHTRTHTHTQNWRAFGHLERLLLLLNFNRHNRRILHLRLFHTPRQLCPHDTRLHTPHTPCHRNHHSNFYPATPPPTHTIPPHTHAAFRSWHTARAGCACL